MTFLKKAFISAALGEAAFLAITVLIDPSMLSLAFVRATAIGAAIVSPLAGLAGEVAGGKDMPNPPAVVIQSCMAGMGAALGMAFGAG